MKKTNIENISTYPQGAAEIINKLSAILKLKNSNFLYRNKILLLLKGLEDYRNSISKKDFSIYKLDKKSKQEFQGFFHHLDEFQNFLERLSCKEKISIILENGYFFDNNYLNSFRTTFNRFVVELRLFASFAKPLRETDQEIGYQLSDIAEYKNIISGTFNQKNDFTEELQNRYDEVTKIEDALNVKKQNNNQKHLRILTQDEFEREIKKITNSILNFDDIEIQTDPIGRGGEAEVRLGYHKVTQQALAVKILNFQTMSYDLFRHFQKEVKMMTELNHFSILQFVGICLHPISIVTEFMPNGSLHDRLTNENDGTPLSPTQRTIIGLGIAYALNYMHKKDPPILHRDVNSFNVLLDSEDFPRLSDFGLSRYANKKNDLSPRVGVGKTQWMAPEVIKGFEYTEKSDVYSYGVLLWELLTGLTPYGGLNQSRLIDKIAYEGSHPEIDRPDCSREMRALLLKCWNQEPKLRPSFDQIIEYFENDTIKFIGTQSDQVKAYISLYHFSESEEHFDFPIITDSVIKSIINELDLKRPNAVQKAIAILTKEENHDFILQFDLIKAIVKTIDSCDSAQTANFLTNAVDLIRTHEKLLNQFVQFDGGLKFIKLFEKFGATSSKHIILTLTFFISNKYAKMTSNAFSKLAPFLLSTDLSCRSNVLKLLLLIYDLSLYDSQNSFNLIIRNLLANIFPKAKIDLLKESLDLLLKLLELSELNFLIMAAEGIVKLIPILSVPEFSLQAFKIIEKVLNQTIPQKNVIIQLLSQIPSICKSSNDDGIKEILTIFAYLLKSRVTISEIQTNDIIACFKNFLNSKNDVIIICSLKLICSFLFNSITRFVELTDQIILLLNNENQTISLLSASFLSLSYQNISFSMSNQQDADLIKQFLLFNLNKETVPVQVLNLCGVLSASYEGSLFLEKIGAIPLIAKLITIDKTEISLKSAIILASLSASNPLSKHLIESLPIMIELIEKQINQKYALVFLGNMAQTSYGAVECAKNIGTLLKFVGNDFQRIIILIDRMLSEENALKIVAENDEYLKLLISFLLKLLKQQKEMKLTLSILAQIVSCQNGRTLISNSEIKNLLQTDFNEMDSKNQSRPLIIRILSQINQ